MCSLIRAPFNLFFKSPLIWSWFHTLRCSPEASSHLRGGLKTTITCHLFSHMSVTIFLESMLVLIDIADSILDAKVVCVAGSEAWHSQNYLVKVWWDMQFVVPILQPRLLNQSQSQQPIWRPKWHLEKIPNNVGNNNSAPKLPVFFVTPPEQGDMEVKEQGQPQWRCITAQLCRAWGEDCAWQMCLVHC